ncbi:MAG: CHASE2 domain-containing protein [Candidatus Methylomirabilales bacterium]
MRRAPRRIPDWLVGLALTAAVLVLAWMRPVFFEGLEARLYDGRLAWLGPRAPVQSLAIVAIDDESIAKLDRWPWPRERLAGLVEKLSAAGARVIGLCLILSEAAAERALQALRTVEQQFRTLGPVKGGAAFLLALQRLAASLDHDARLAEAVRRAGNVVLAGFGALGAGAPAPAPVPDFAAASLVTRLRRSASGVAARVPAATVVTWPLPALAAAAAGLGHINRLPDADGVTRWEPLLIERGGQDLPHFALTVAARSLGIPHQRIQAPLGETVHLGPMAIPTDPAMRLLVPYAGPGRTVPRYAAFDALNGRIAPAAFQGKTVLVGATAPGLGDVEATPFDPVFAGVEKHTQLVAWEELGKIPVDQEMQSLRYSLALSKDPAHRFQTGAEAAKTLSTLRERLDAALAQAGRAGRPA